MRQILSAASLAAQPECGRGLLTPAPLDLSRLMPIGRNKTAPLAPVNPNPNSFPHRPSVFLYSAHGGGWAELPATALPPAHPSATALRRRPRNTMAAHPPFSFTFSATPARGGWKGTRPRRSVRRRPRLAGDGDPCRRGGYFPSAQHTPLAVDLADLGEEFVGRWPLSSPQQWTTAHTLPPKGCFPFGRGGASPSTARFFVLCLGMPMHTGSRGTARPETAAQLCRRVQGFDR
jgi:hypothetical protein